MLAECLSRRLKLFAAHVHNDWLHHVHCLKTEGLVRLKMDMNLEMGG